MTEVRAVAVRAFSDAGSGRRFAAGQPISLPEGEFDNFRAAGLVRAAPEEPEADAPAPPPNRFFRKGGKTPPAWPARHERKHP